MRSNFYGAKVFLIGLLFSFTSIGQETDDSTQVKVKIHFIEGYNIEGYGDTLELQAIEAINLIEKVINSERFRDSILKYSLTQVNGMSNAQFYNTIKRGKERYWLNYRTEGIMDFRIRTMSQERDGSTWMANCKIKEDKTYTVGKEGTTGVMVTCPESIVKWYKEDSLVIKLSGHLFHEYLHQLGFKHRGFGKRKYNSAVYKVGRLVTELVEEELKRK